MPICKWTDRAPRTQRSVRAQRPDTAGPDTTRHDAGRRGQSARITHHAPCDASRLVDRRGRLSARAREGAADEREWQITFCVTVHREPCTVDTDTDTDRPLSRPVAFAIPIRPSRWFGRRHGCVNRSATHMQRCFSLLLPGGCVWAASERGSPRQPARSLAPICYFNAAAVTETASRFRAPPIGVRLRCAALLRSLLCVSQPTW